jgi:hypothetical protein
MTPNKPDQPPRNPSAPSVYTHITLPAALYDKAFQDARRHRMTLPDWIRHRLRQAAPAPAADSPDRS